MELLWKCFSVLAAFSRLSEAEQGVDMSSVTTGIPLNINTVDSCMDMTTEDAKADNNSTDNSPDKKTGQVDTKAAGGQLSPLALIHMGSVSESTYNKFFDISSKIQFPIYIIAFIFNIFNVVVYCQKQMRSPTSTILIALCGTEATYLILSLTAAILRLVYAENAMTSNVYLTYGLYVSNYLSVSFRRVGFCYTCLVSAERFIAVTFPLQAKSFRLVKYPAVVCILILMSALLFHLYSPLKYTIISYTTSQNTTAYRFKYTTMYMKDKTHFENVSMASKFIFVYFMLLGCLIFNLLIVISLRRHKKNRMSMKTSQNSAGTDKRDRQTTITIMVSTCVYVFLALPLNTNSIINNLRDDYGIFTREHFLFFLLSNVGALCELMSNCTNFIFYIVLSAKFRQTFLQIFMSCRGADFPDRSVADMGSTDTRISNISQKCNSWI